MDAAIAAADQRSSNPEQITRERTELELTETLAPITTPSKSDTSQT
jgi:hypothetical protein